MENVGAVKELCKLTVSMDLYQTNLAIYNETRVRIETLVIDKFYAWETIEVILVMK